VQATQPLRVAHVGLAAWYMFGVARVDQHHLEPALLEYLIGGDPVDAGGFHGDRSYPARLEPVGQTVQVAREGAEGADRFWIASLSDCCHVHGGADVDCGGIGMYRGYVAARL
jgi:hypothetical protein